METTYWWFAGFSWLSLVTSTDQTSTSKGSNYQKSIPEEFVECSKFLRGEDNFGGQLINPIKIVV